MIPWETLDTVRVAGSGEVLRLARRGGEFSITIDGRELMNSRQHASEDALAELGCEGIRQRKEPRVLIGGLGMGFTLAAALRQVGPSGRVDVAELVPAVVEWNRGPLGEVAAYPLSDRRSTVLLRDVTDVIFEARDCYDAILLDVDNGPDAPLVSGNQRLYDGNGLLAARRALKAGGVLAVWSAAGPCRPFTNRLRRSGFDAREAQVRSRGRQGGARHTIWVARVPSGRSRKGPA